MGVLREVCPEGLELSIRGRGVNHHVLAPDWTRATTASVFAGRPAKCFREVLLSSCSCGRGDFQVADSRERLCPGPATDAIP